MITKKQDPISLDQLDRFKSFLTEKPIAFGPKITDREPWGKIQGGKTNELLERARAIVSQPVPQFSRDLYLEFSKSGKRGGYQSDRQNCFEGLSTLVLAEGVEGKGSFIPTIENWLNAICNQPTWVLPAHDLELDSLEGNRHYIDLSSSGYAWQLSCALRLLESQLSIETKGRVLQELEKRIWGPFRRSILTNSSDCPWLHVKSNWNVVCLSGVVGSALQALDSREDRALFLLAAEHYLKNYFSSYGEDGYCMEGLAYWNYGFGYFSIFTELVFQATEGNIDFWKNERVNLMANYPRRMEVLPSVYAAIGDSKYNTKPIPWLTWIVSQRVNGIVSGDRVIPEWRSEIGLPFFMTTLFSNYFGLVQFKEEKSTVKKPLALRDSFDSAGIKIFRSIKDKDFFGALIKGGKNDGPHIHHDVGSFVIGSREKLVVIDAGGEVYTKRTFSSSRYESMALNSFGHSVPRLAGMLQRGGEDSVSKVVKQNFTDDVEDYSLDLTSVYDKKRKKISKYIRNYRFSRAKEVFFEVEDCVEYTSPQAFESALILFEDPKKGGKNEWIFGGETGSAVSCKIDTELVPYQTKVDVINEDYLGKIKPKRWSISIESPMKSVKVTLRFTPQVIHKESGD